MAKTKTTEASSLPELCIGAVLRYGKADALNHRTEGKVALHFRGTVCRTSEERRAWTRRRRRYSRRSDRAVVREPARWSIVDLAILSLGAINVPIYTTQAVDQIEFILSDSGAKAIFISNRRLYKHAQSALANRQLDHLIFSIRDCGRRRSRDRPGPAGTERGKSTRRNVPELSTRISAPSGPKISRRSSTSGTTGEPKGVMLTHNNFMSNVLSIGTGLPIESTDVALSVLPLSHIFERAGFYVFCYCGRFCLLLRFVRSGRRELA